MTMNKLAYAGIGSRETPPNILKIMNHIGSYLCVQGWTLRSGAATGADKAFEDGANLVDNGIVDFTKTEIYLPWKGFNHSTSELHPANMPFSQKEIEFTSKFHPAWHKCSPSARLLHQRNTRIILSCAQLAGEHVIPVRFVICWTKDGKGEGGTGQALRIAHALGIPVIDFGQARSPEQLEAQVLEVDHLQGKIIDQQTQKQEE